MTLDEFKAECAAVLAAMPKGTGSREKYPVSDDLKWEIVNNLKSVRLSE